jgi:hypothetical protein
MLNNVDPNYTMTYENTPEIFKNFGCNMSMKVHFLWSHLDYSIPNLGGFSDVMGKHFTRT